jgi:SAM-dependent methyltransferase
VLRRAELPPGASLLEIGCGPGNATRQFAAAGHPITCIEPGVRLAALAASNLASHPHVRIENARFEEWPIRAGAFHLVYAAQSFHWVDPDVGYARAARCLCEGGALALFWNRPAGTDPRLRAALDAVYERHAPGLSRVTRPLELPGVEEAVARTGCFGPVEISHYRWTDVRSADEYARLTATYSDHAALPEAQRRALLDALREAIELNGGTIAAAQVAVLYFTRRRAGTPS